MKRIVECLLEEGIDESMVHRILDLIEEEYEIVNEFNDDTKLSCGKKRVDNLVGEVNKFAELKKEYPKGSNATIEDKTANIKAQAQQEKNISAAQKKLSRYNKLAGSGIFSRIKDNDKRQEIADYGQQEIGKAIDNLNKNK